MIMNIIKQETDNMNENKTNINWVVVILENH